MIGFLLLMIGMAVTEGSKLYVRKRWRELAAFVGVWITATTYGGLMIYGVKLPKPTQIITSMLERLF